MENKNKTIILLSILVLILIVVFIVLRINKKQQVVINTNTEENNVVTNNLTEDNIQTEEIENNTVQSVDIKDNNQQNNSNVGTEEIPKEIIQKAESDKEKAINIVKKDWGEDSTAYFTADDKTDDKGNYIVQVREKSTTRTISIYIVNVVTSTFTKE